MSVELEALQRAVSLLGGQTELAIAVERAGGKKCNQRHVWNWLNRQKRVPGNRAVPIEQATGGRVRRHELRPDLYPPQHFDQSA